MVQGQGYLNVSVGHHIPEGGVVAVCQVLCKSADQATWWVRDLLGPQTPHGYIES